MSFIDANKARAQRVAGRAMAEKYYATPGLIESTRLAYRETKQLELISSEAANRREHFAPQRDAIMELVNSGAIDRDVYASFRGRPDRRGRRKTDWQGLADYINPRFGRAFDFSEETLIESINAETEERQARLSRAGLSGSAGAFLGTAGAYVTDPLELAILAVTAPFGGGAATIRVAGGVISAGARYAAREAALGLGVEALNQVNIHRYKTYLGQEYKLSDAAANVLVAGLLSGVIGGAIGAGVKARDLRMKAYAELTPDDVKSVTAAVEDIISDSVVAFESNRPFDPRRPSDLAASFKPGAPFARKGVTVEDDLIRVRETYIRELETAAGKKLTRGEVKQITRDIQQLKQTKNSIEASPAPAPGDKKLSARRAKQAAQKRGVAEAVKKRADIQRQIDALQKRLDDDAVSLAAKADLSRVAQDITPPELKRRLDEVPPRFDDKPTPAIKDPIAYGVSLARATSPDLRDAIELKVVAEKIAQTASVGEQVIRQSDTVLTALQTSRSEPLPIVTQTVEAEAVVGDVVFDSTEMYAAFKQTVPDATLMPDGRALREHLDEIQSQYDEAMAAAEKFGVCIRG